MLHDLAATPSEERPRVGSYKILYTIGKGSFAKVKLARHLPTGIEVAVKVIDQHRSYRPYREVQSMKSLNHPNIVKLFEVIDTKNKLFLIMEHVDGGNLSDHLEDYDNGMTEHEARGIFRQLMSAVHYCHQRGIVHRDLKPRNILLDADGSIKLADFGLSNEYVGRKLTSFCGSPNYVAPEILLGGSYDGPRADVWSLGVILFKMVCGRLPFVARDPRELGRRIVEGQYHLPFFISSDLEDLIGKCLTVDPCCRGTLDELMRHTWMNVGQEELRPYEEPPGEALDPQVIQEMRALGFEEEEIEESLREKRYDRTMATYLLLSHKAAKGKGRTIMVRPFPGTESSLAGSHESHGVRPPDWEIQEPASPAAGADGSAAIPAPTPELGTSAPAAGPASGTTSPAPQVEAETSTALTAAERETTSPVPQQEAGTGTALTAAERGTTSPVPQQEAGTGTTLTAAERGTTSPVPQQEAGTGTTLTAAERGTTSPVPQQEAGTGTALTAAERETTSPVPQQEAGTGTALTAAERGTTSPVPQQEAGTGTTLTAAERETTSPVPQQEAGTGTALTAAECGTTSPVPQQEAGTSSPSPQPGPQGTVSTSRSSGQSGAPERQPEVETPTSSSGRSRGILRVARRFCRFWARHFCCGRSKVQP